MTPQMQQAIRMLQLSTLELKTEIQQVLESNPFLELEEPSQTPENSDQENTDASSHEEYEQRLFEQADWQSNASHRASSVGSSDNWLENTSTEIESLQDHLLFQLEMGRFTLKDQFIGTVIIESIDSRGFLTSDLQGILETAQAQWEAIKHQYVTEDLDEMGISLSDWLDITLEDVSIALKRIQHFDPKGVGARDITECLALQLQATPVCAAREDALFLIEQHSQALAGQNIKILLKKSSLSLERVQAALALLRTLETAPGEKCCPTNNEYVIPDVIAYKYRNQWRIALNPEVAPHVKLNDRYVGIPTKRMPDDEREFFKTNMQDAKWFLKSLQSRHDTLLKIAQDILEQQIDFFEEGEVGMKPMILADVAQRVEMHESTVSRVTTQKYIHTPRGVFELKYFFSSHVGTDDGGECSSTAIRAKIKQLIAEENTDKPLSDNKIAQALEEDGINIARRTVAKYRELDKIPSSSERKKTF